MLAREYIIVLTCSSFCRIEFAKEGNSPGVPGDKNDKDSSRSLLSDESSEDLHRTLTATDLVLFGIGNTIGAGIFALTGIAA